MKKYAGKILKPIWVMVCLSVMIQLAGCQNESIVTAEGFEKMPDATVQTTSATINSTQAFHSRENRWIEAPDLYDCLAELQHKAQLSGYSADWIQPDSTQKKYFLIVAPDEQSARQMNGFFYWYIDRSMDQSGEPSLVLCIDHLFTEIGRPAATACGSYSDPAVVSLLEYSLKRVLQADYQRKIGQYVLECYRRRFRQCLKQPGASAFSEQETLNRIEVNFNASIYHSFTFKRLAG